MLVDGYPRPRPPYSSLKSCPNTLPTASRELTPWAVTSVPIPSPGNTEMSKSTFGFPPGPSSGFFHPSAQGPVFAPQYTSNANRLQTTVSDMVLPLTPLWGCDTFR